MTEKGYTHIYTGNGKGKTTAAFGLAIRALCADKQVYIGQFVKQMRYNETNIDKIFNNIEIEQYGQGCMLDRNPDATDRELALEGFNKCIEKLQSGKYDVVIMDELNIALHLNLLPLSLVTEAIKNKPEKIELIITGRHASQELIDLADLVTEMKEVKHYYQNGILARNGIDK